MTFASKPRHASTPVVAALEKHKLRQIVPASPE
jgi:hypothetical protein